MKALLLLVLIGVATQAVAANMISADGFGVVKVGMSERQVARALGVRLTVGGEGRNADCYHVEVTSGVAAGLSIMLHNYRVVRVSNYGDRARITSDHGIRIGAGETAVLRAYHQPPQRTLHAYGDGVHDVYLTWWRKDGRGVRYEIVGGRVVSIHGGNDAIELVEGCS